MTNMPPQEANHDLCQYQDVLGQLPMLQGYTHLLYTFSLKRDVLRDEVAAALENAINSIRTAFPWIAARVVNRGKTIGNSGLYRLVSCPPPDELLSVKDLSNTLPPYVEIKAMKAPMSAFDSAILSPVSSFPSRFDDAKEGQAHVVRVQATFIQGGVLLDFAIHHNAADGTGLYGYIKLVAQLMRGESISDAALREGNKDRRNLVPLLSSDEPMLDHSHYIRLVMPPTAGVKKSEPMKYHMFRFTEANIRKLKGLATSPESVDIKFISSDDAICAFIWQRYIALRAHQFSRDTRSRFLRAMDGRKLVGLTRDYFGDTVHNVATWLTFGELVDLPLCSIAAHLRRRLNESNTTYHLRSFATFIAKEPDKTKISYVGHFNPETDIGCTSVRGRSDVFPDFGILGRPDFIRRPPTTPFPSLVALLPGSLAGDCDIWTCLKDDDIAGLKNDATWNEFVEYIG